MKSALIRLRGSLTVPSSPLLVKVAARLRRLGLPQGGSVVAVSGGPDSVALLRALLHLRQPTSSPLFIAHLNHGLRGADSDADETSVRELHARLAASHQGLHFRSERIDVAAEARAAGANLEATARRLRYDWLAGVAREHGASVVATGHTGDDQAETVLHRLLRGAGLQGLRGIAPRRPLGPGVELVRPLLDVTRAEVIAFLESESQPWRQDTSNRDPRHTRNRIRHELLPHLAEHYNPGVRKVLARLAEQAEEAFREDQARTAALLAEAEKPRAGAVLVFDLARLAAEPRQRVRPLFRFVWQREGWPLAGMGFDHWRRLEGLVFDGGAAVDLPGGLRARRREHVVQLGPREPG
jgi:tRNA(Ile)-lysidine synthase